MGDGIDYGPDVTVAVREPDGGVRAAGTAQAWPVFSATKMFVAVAALRLVEDGRLELDAEAHKWLPAAPPDVTVRELLNHTAGLPNYAGTAAYHAAVDANPGRPWGLDQVLEVGLAGERPPRGRFRYSNTGYWLLGAVLEGAAGEPLERLLDALVFAPAGMASTRYPAVGAGITHSGYDTRWAGPAGAAWSTTHDLVTFLSALASGPLLSAASRAAMTTPVPVDPETPWRRPGYGLGLMIDGGLGTIGHGGGGPGYGSAAFATPATGRAVAVIKREPSTLDLTAVALELLDGRC